MLLLIPLIYFTTLAIFFFLKHKCLNLDIAACAILIVVSVSSLMIDINDLYGDYGINEDCVTLPAILLYCLQWTLFILPLHIISSYKLERHDEVKKPILYILYGLLIVSSLVMIVTSLSDIRDAIIMDAVDMYRENAALREISVKTDANYIMLLPQILTSAPFPTMALFFWFYAKTFTNCPMPIRIGLLVCSIVQAVLSIITAGRAALIYWVFDFFLIFGFFYQYLSKKLKRGMLIVSAIIGTFIIGQMLVVTISRFGDDSGESHRDPLESLYAYAGQHVDNFCADINEGGNAPLQIGRIFPLTNKIVNHEDFDLIQHYENIHANVNILVNVFDTFGGEVFLDLGWIGFVMLLIILFAITTVMKTNWEGIQFHRVFILIVLIAAFTRGVFAWPFVGHYTTLALLMTFLIMKLFQYTFKI